MSNTKSSYKFVIFAIAIFFVSIAASSAFAQNVNVAGALVGNGTYPDLGSAFTAINGGAQTGSVITVSVVGGTTETAAAVLNANDWTSLTISPSGGGPRTVTGAIVGHLIDLNGADNVTIDGLNTGGNSLTISNTDTSSSASTIRFTADASNNTVTNCTVLGSTGSSLSSGFGVIYFGSATVTGNDNNTISNNNITAAGANLPISGIFSQNLTAATNNSGIIISGNNISDYFNTNSSSSGINVNSGNSAWTISNNKLFQTATRTYLAAATHNGISITSGSGYAITGNTIGYANSAGTGTTNMVGLSSGALGGTFPSAYTVGGVANATRYVAINAAFTVAGTVSEIQDNTVAGFALYTSSGAATTSGIFCGIAVTSGNVNIGTTTGNTIGATTGNGSIYTATTTTGGMIAGIYVTSGNAVAIRNNTIGALDAMGTSATLSGGINGINVAGASSSYDVSGNTVGNSTNPNLRMGNLTTGANLSNVGTTFGIGSGTGQFNGILSSQTGAGTIGTQALPNTVRNASLNSSSATASIRGITASGIPTISYNSINNLTSQSANAGVASTLLGGMGIFLNSISTSGAVVRNNTINSLSLANTTTTGTNITGVAIYAGSTDLFANTIYDISNASTSVTAATPGTATGFFMRQPGGTINIYNNMVSLGNGQTGNTSFNGIWQQNSAVAYTLNASYNTINIEGTVAAGAQPSFGLNRGSYSATQVTVAVNPKNNIFNNTRSGGTGKHYAIANNYLAAATATGWGTGASNNNVLNANAATVGYWGADQTFAGWQAASAGDLASYSGVGVTFVNSANNLHLNMGVTPTTIESGGVAIAGITTDIDGQTRPGPAGSVNGGAFAPDIGADEFDGVYLDLVAPNIAYTALGFTCTGSARTLTATITDGSGVPTAGAGIPVLYWKINAGAYTPVTGVSMGGGQYQFTFGGGAVTGDTVSYYVVAQDSTGTPNVTSFPLVGASGFTSNPPAAATPPTTPSSYTVTTVLPTGTYTVGAAGAYTTLTAAINAYNTQCLNGPVVFSLIDPTYSEAGQMTVIKHPDGSALNTLTIRPATGVTASVSATVASGAILKVLGNYVTIDGSNNGSTSRDLTLANASVTSPSVVHIGSTGTSPINNVTLKNSIVINGANTSSAVVTSDGGVLGSEGYFNNITITNNDVQRAFIGSYSIAAPIAGNGSGLNISNNTMSTVGANAIRRVGIYVQGVDGSTISGNTLGNFDSATAEADYGIWLASNSINSTVSSNTISTLACAVAGSAPTGIILTSSQPTANLTVTGNTISGLTSAGGAAGVSTNGIFLGLNTGNVSITRNTISNIKNTSATGWGSAGIVAGSTNTAANVLVANNFVSDVASFGFGGSTVDDNGNGIAVTAGAGYGIYNNTVVLTSNQGSAAGNPAALLVTSGVTLAGAVDVRNNIFANTQAGGSTERYSIYSGAANTVFSNINFNDYTSAGPNLGFIGSNRVDLTAVQAGFGGNANSVSVAPLFVSGTDFHLQFANPSLVGGGTPIGSVTVDYDNDPRPATAPDIGADEIVQATAGVIAGGTYYNASAAPGDSLGGNVTINGALYLNGVLAGGANTLTLGCNGVVVGAGAANYVNGAVRKDFCALGAFAFPVGQGAYTPVDVTVTALATNPSSLTATSFDAVLSPLAPSTSLSRNWLLTETGDLTADLIFTYDVDANDVNGNESDYRVFKRDSANVTTNMCPGAPCVNTATNQLGPITGVSTFSRWGAGENLVPVAAGATITGRVTTADGQGIRNAAIVVTGNSLQQPRIVKSASLGYYTIEDLQVGETFVITVNSKRFTFQVPSRVISLTDSVEGIDFVADPLQ